MKALLICASALAVSGCAMQPLTPEQQEYMRQWSLEQQRANNQQQLEAQRAMLNSNRPGLAAPSIQPASVQAFWTGKSQMGQSVTGAFGTNCEYQYGVQKFWRMFQGSCPSSIEVR